jgi:hypothetical protein
MNSSSRMELKLISIRMKPQFIPTVKRKQQEPNHLAAKSVINFKTKEVSNGVSAGRTDGSRPDLFEAKPETSKISVRKVVLPGEFHSCTKGPLSNQAKISPKNQIRII